MPGPRQFSRPRAAARPAPARRSRFSARPASGTAAERRRVTQELRALAHPLRLRLLECFAQGPRTTMQVAADLGEPPTRLYHHVNALERAGLLRLRETRPNRGTTEKYFEVARHRIGVTDPALLAGGSGEALRALAAQVLDEARREMLGALTGATSREPSELPLAVRMVLSISPARQLAFRRRLVAALKALERDFDRGDAERSRPWALTLAYAPAARGARATAPAAPPRARRRSRAGDTRA